MGDTPARLPQVGETWTTEAGRRYELLFIEGPYGHPPLVVLIAVAADLWTPPEPPIEWERWLNKWGHGDAVQGDSSVWRIVKREGQEPTIERVEPS